MRFILTPLLALSLLSGCATLGGVVTPQRCEQALIGSRTAEEAVKVLMRGNILSAEDSALAIQLILEGRVTIQAVCAVAEGTVPIPPEPETDPAQPEPVTNVL